MDRSVGEGGREGGRISFALYICSVQTAQCGAVRSVFDLKIALPSRSMLLEGEQWIEIFG